MQQIKWKIQTADDISEDGDLSSVYREHYEILLNYGSQFNVDKASVQDCIHDLFVDLWKSSKDMSELSSTKAYLLRSLKNKIYKKLKKRRINIDIDGDNLDNKIFPIQLSVEQSLIRAEKNRNQQQFLDQQINALGPRQRELIYHIFYNDLSYEEVSQILGISKKTAYNLVLRAINNLRKEIDLSKLSILSLFTLNWLQ